MGLKEDVRALFEQAAIENQAWLASHPNAPRFEDDDARIERIRGEKHKFIRFPAELRALVAKVKSQIVPEESIENWWWTPVATDIGGYSGRMRPWLAADFIRSDAYSIVSDHNLPSDVITAQGGLDGVVVPWLELILGGPLYPPGGVEPFLREWSGANQQEAAA